MSEYDPFAMLLEAVEAIDAGQTDVARQVLLALVNDCLDLDERPHEITPFLFALALFKRIDTQLAERQNIYLRKYGVSQINLFALLVTKVPFVAEVYGIANALLAEQLAGMETPALLDVGIGKGWQEVHLIEHLAAHDALPQELTIFGIEPDSQSLEEAADNIANAAAQCGLKVHFHSTCALIEDVDEEVWDTIASHSPQLVLNESFTLHHLAFDGDGGERRDQALQRLATLGAAGLVISEPHVDHHETDLVQRFRNCWEHFSLGFHVIDQVPDIEENDKHLLKIHFFGREIEDILGNQESLRCERHEPIHAWIARAQAAGFVPHAPAIALPQGVPVIDITAQADHVSLGYKGETLIGVCSVKAPPSPDASATKGAKS